jgi:single-strand DNA-binding protein
MSVNSTLVTAVGRLVSGIQTYVIPTGARVANFRIACQERIYDKDRGSWMDGDRMYIDVACWRQTAENVAASLQEGDLVVVRGRLKIRNYTSKDGQQRTAVEIDASSVGADLAFNPVVVNRLDWRTSPNQQTLLDPPPTDLPAAEDGPTRAEVAQAA